MFMLMLRGVDVPGSIFRIAVLKYETKEIVEFDVARDDSNGLMILDELMTSVAMLAKDIESVENEPPQCNWDQMLALTDDIRRRIVGAITDRQRQTR